MTVENRTRQNVLARIKSGWSAFGKYREVFFYEYAPSLESKVFNQYSKDVDVKRGLCQKH